MPGGGQAREGSVKILSLVFVILGITLGAIVWLSRERQATPAARRRHPAPARQAQPPVARSNGASADAVLPVEAPAPRARIEVDDEHAFYFRGPAGELNVPARSIETFFDLAESLEEDVWVYHLARGDCARWFRDVIRDERLASEAERLASARCSASESRRLLQSAVAV